MMKQFITIAMSVLLIFSSQSCSDFDEINTDPNRPSDIEASLLMAAMLKTGVDRLYSTFNGGDMGSCWAQHWAKIQYNDECLYIPRETALDNMWNNFYTSVAADAEVMRQVAAEAGNSNVQGVGLVMKAWAFATLADCFGNVPFSESLVVGNFTPAYDEEEDVYRGVLQWLDEAVALLGEGGIINSVSDVLYGGDAAKWEAFANSLKFRILMRISARDGSTDIDVAGGLADIYNNRTVFASRDDEAKMAYLISDPNANPIWETINFDGRSEFRVGEPLVEMLKVLGDPRLEVYAQPNDGGEYVGKPAGILGVPNNDWNAATVSRIGEIFIGDASATPDGMGPESPGYILSYSELMFLMAEAAQKGFISGDASTFYNEGIKASFESVGLTAAQAADYAAQPNVDLDQLTNKLKAIAEQNWLALFNQGVEAWTEVRRTGYPELDPAIDGAIDEIPSRYNYPNLESSINPVNYEAASAAIGGNALDTRVWWMD